MRPAFHQQIVINPATAHPAKPGVKLCVPCRKDGAKRNATRVVASVPMCTAHAAQAWKPSPILATLDFHGELPDAD